MALRLDDERRTRLSERLRGFVAEEFDQDLSPFRAEQLLDFVLETIGPQIYNQAVQDARRFMQQKLEDLEGDVHEPEAHL